MEKQRLKEMADDTEHQLRNLEQRCNMLHDNNSRLEAQSNSLRQEQANLLGHLETIRAREQQFIQHAKRGGSLVEDISTRLSALFKELQATVQVAESAPLPPTPSPVVQHHQPFSPRPMNDYYQYTEPPPSHLAQPPPTQVEPTQPPRRPSIAQDQTVAYDIDPASVRRVSGSVDYHVDHLRGSMLAFYVCAHTCVFSGCMGGKYLILSMLIFRCCLVRMMTVVRKVRSLGQMMKIRQVGRDNHQVAVLRVSDGEHRHLVRFQVLHRHHRWGLVVVVLLDQQQRCLAFHRDFSVQQSIRLVRTKITMMVRPQLIIILVPNFKMSLNKRKFVKSDEKIRGHFHAIGTSPWKGWEEMGE